MRLAPLPQTFDPHYWRGKADEFAALEKQALEVSVSLVTPYIGANGSRLHFDAILSFAVLASFKKPSRWPAGGACVVPLPLELLSTVQGVRGELLPVWAASDLLPSTDLLRDRAYWHKRYPSDRADLAKKRSADMGTGRWKEYRVPIALSGATTLKAIVIGHAASILEALEVVSFVGKKNSQGHGRVEGWSVAPIAGSLEDARKAIALERPMPSAQPGSSRMGFTPPYSFAPWHAPCQGAR